MSAKTKLVKRKSTPLIKDKIDEEKIITVKSKLGKAVTAIPADQPATSTDDDSDSEEILKNNLIDGGSSNDEDDDEEDNEELYTSDEDDDALSFESDTDGNYQRKPINLSELNAQDDDDIGSDEEGEGDDDDVEDDIGSDAEDNDSEDDEDYDDDLDSDEDEGEDDSDEDDKSLSDDKETEEKEEKNTSIDIATNGVGKSDDKPIIEKVDTVVKASKQLQKKKKQEKSKEQNQTKTAENLQKSMNRLKNVLNKDKKNVTTDADDNLKDEYKEDTSDEEDIRNTVGNIPMHWYDEYKHIGYDWDAKKIIKPARKDQLENFLSRMEDPNFWRTVKDPQTGQDVILSEEDIKLIKLINSGKIPDASYNEYEPWIDWFTSEVERMPIRNVPDHKRSFLPSKSEKKTVSKLVNAIKMGWIKNTNDMKKDQRAKKGPQFYMLWETDTDKEKMRRIHDHVSAPKRDLPGHAESYNPPAEYLFDEKEMKEWEKMKEEPQRRKLHFLPQKYKSLREVPAYPRYLRERFLRCLDLYLCPRARRMKLTIDSEYLIPKLPSAKDLQPFPTVESMVYTGHTDMIRTISMEPNGEYFVSGSDDTTVKIWEIQTGRCIRTIETGDIVRSVAWCPNPKLSLIAIASGQRVILLNPKVGDKLLVKKTDDILEVPPTGDTLESDRIKVAVQWNAVTDKDDYNVNGYRIILTHFKPVKQVTWHGKGDYFATVMPEGANRSTLIHQLSRRRSQIPFSKSKGLIQCVLFHPVKPCLFVATQKNIRIYDLVKQELIKKLLSNSKWISDMAIHPKGDNLLVSTYDKKMLWFDLDLSTKPYQTIRLHKNAVRSSAYHLRYPLFASASDDLTVIVSHGMVYNDLIQNPLIVPLKKLQTHKPFEDFGVFDVIWHPTQPWVLSAGADSTVRLYS